MTTMTSTGIEDRQNPDHFPHLVALDVDGTLVDHDGHMSAGVREAAEAAIAAGHHLVIATGRSYGAALPILERLGITEGYCVASNGGVTLRVDTSLPDGYEVIDRVVFDPRTALDALRIKLPTAKFALEDSHGNFLSTERFQDASFGVEAQAVDFERLRSAEAVRVVVFSVDSTAEEFGEAVRAIGLHGVTYSVGWTAWLDIAAEGVTKASALENVRSRLDIDRKYTLAMGDGRNDIEMLGWAARGVAMGQAPAEVLEVATEVTGTVYEDGAATILRGLANN
ncbi:MULTISPECIES: HAD family hydrolase [Arthrobacter]|uniref:Cof-type HAD-IIB family hydrolase n=1 Tax=Arthrobacter sunyaminii TaxID=2816859 RepID=A0A975PFD5_9MICC|nr:MULTISPECIES: HAD family hydrolase [Arthrobacter]MBO0896838.1 HAD family phosphatase [Arthrobacter sunyaminii]MBO0909321.1 HAD family phosphatase [Arthrobacter sunyaminii]QWQ36353.1 Cof-type HAD-IIB family hydrolase [Arthrobacter sunyaminii]